MKKRSEEELIEWRRKLDKLPERDWAGEPTEGECLKRLKGKMEALNNINSSRMLWAMDGATDIVKRSATDDQREQIINSVETIVRVWTKTLKDLKV